jgi:uncharacterized membrane protein HdeD (DUF308 family)
MDEQTMQTQRRGRLSRLESGVSGGGFLLGLLWTIAGVLCVGATGLASLAAVYYVGAILALSGVLGIAFGFRGGGAGVLILGVLSLVVGALLFIHPGEGMLSLTLLAIGYFMIAGIFRIATSIADRYEGWGWDFAYGASAIAIAIIAARAWPLSTFWLLGMLLGAELIARGVAVMATAITARHAMRALHEGRAS